MSMDLRSLYEQMKQVQSQEQAIRKHLSELTEARNQIRTHIEQFMESSNVQVINVSGTPDSMELVEERKYETLSKDALIKKIATFFHSVGSSEEYRRASPTDQAQALIQNVFLERNYTVVRKLKVKTNRSAQRVREAIEQSAAASVASSSPEGGGGERRRIVRRNKH
jgi:exonuclease VII large subunit